MVVDRFEIVACIEASRRKVHAESADRLDATVVPFSLLYRHRARFATLLVNALRMNSYELSPAKKNTLKIENKDRIIYRNTPLDSVVISAYSRWLSEAIEPTLSPRLFSYRKGMSTEQVLKQLMKYIRNHCREIEDPRKRGLYVLKRDIAAYGESIPTHESSRLWTLLNSALSTRNGSETQNVIPPIVTSMIRPTFIDEHGRNQILTTGTPTGSPIQPPLCNLYLSDLDAALDSIEGGFYARYGDDFIFAHSNAAIVREASETIDRIVSSLELKIRLNKRKNYYFTAAGGCVSPQWAETIPSSYIEYLGCRISFTGLQLKKQKTRVLLRQVLKRVHNTIRLLQGEEPDLMLRSVCEIVNQALTSDSEFAHKNAHLLRQLVNDRTYLRQLDYLLALGIAKAMTGIHSVKAFRKIPYRSLREDFGLLSLEQSLNRLGKAADR